MYRSPWWWRRRLCPTQDLLDRNLGVQSHGCCSGMGLLVCLLLQGVEPLLHGDLGSRLSSAFHLLGELGHITYLSLSFRTLWGRNNIYAIYFVKQPASLYELGTKECFEKKCYKYWIYCCPPVKLGGELGNSGGFLKVYSNFMRSHWSTFESLFQLYEESLIYWNPEWHRRTKQLCRRDQSHRSQPWVQIIIIWGNFTTMPGPHPRES